MADLPPLREVIAKYDLRAKKALGQNFLLDLNLTGRIARAAGPLQDVTVYEVGPGPGGLTRALLAEGAKRVVAVERDPRCIAALADVQAAYPDRLELIEGDALEIDEPQILGDGPVKIVANLPYNVGTQLLIKWLTPKDWPPFWASLNLMFQKEVAERIVAHPGGKAYGRLSVLSQWRGAARKVFDVPRQAFTPPPQVTSAIVGITPGKPVMDVSLKSLEKVTAAAFGQRRKMVRAALKQLNCDVEALLAEAGIDPTTRAENIDVLGFCRLAKAYGAGQ